MHFLHGSVASREINVVKNTYVEIVDVRAPSQGKVRHEWGQK